MEILNLSNKSPNEKVSIINSLVKESGDNFVFITMESKVKSGITDRVTRIYSKEILKFHASNYIVLIQENGKPFMSDKGTSAFCSDSKMQEQLEGMMGDWKSFEFWTEKSTFLYAFTGKRHRDLIKGSLEVDRLIGESSFEWFFNKYKNEFQWAMSEGRKVNLLKDRRDEDIPAFYMGEDKWL
jgi:hypothetical protein